MTPSPERVVTACVVCGAPLAEADAICALDDDDDEWAEENCLALLLPRSNEETPVP